MGGPVSWRFLKRAGRWMLRRNADFVASGLERIPDRGPVIIASRHYHHLYDGCALIGWIQRPAFAVVALDWTASPIASRGMALLCRAARWPVVLREGSRGSNERMASSRRDAAGRMALRAGAAEAIAHLRAGNVVVVFPEGYPNIDPQTTPKVGDEFLPFEPGFASLARMAQRQGADTVNVVPVGFHYVRDGDDGRWSIAMHIGEPRRLADFDSPTDLAAAIEADVHRLSTPSTIGRESSPG